MDRGNADLHPSSGRGLYPPRPCRGRTAPLVYAFCLPTSRRKKFMGVFLLIALAVAATIVAYGTAVFIPALVVAIVALWANGVMWNYRDWPDSAPDWATLLSILAAAGSVILLIVAIVLRVA